MLKHARGPEFNPSTSVKKNIAKKANHPLTTQGCHSCRQSQSAIERDTLVYTCRQRWRPTSGVQYPGIVLKYCVY